MHPESITVELWAIDIDDPLAASDRGGGRKRGVTLREMRDQLGGDVGQVLDMYDCSHDVSLARWADADPDRTLIVTSFRGQRIKPPTKSLDPDNLPPIRGARVAVLPDIDAADQTLDGEPCACGITLREFREQIGGDTGVVTDHADVEHAVSIADLANADPDRTRVQVQFFLEPSTQD
jgi:hypothetical protein